MLILMVQFTDNALTFTAKLMEILLHWYNKVDVGVTNCDFIKSYTHILYSKTFPTLAKYVSIYIFIFTLYLLYWYITAIFKIDIAPTV